MTGRHAWCQSCLLEKVAKCIQCGDHLPWNGGLVCHFCSWSCEWTHWFWSSILKMVSGAQPFGGCWQATGWICHQYHAKLGVYACGICWSASDGFDVLPSEATWWSKMSSILIADTMMVEDEWYLVSFYHHWTWVVFIMIYLPAWGPMADTWAPTMDDTSWEGRRFCWWAAISRGTIWSRTVIRPPGFKLQSDAWNLMS